METLFQKAIVIIEFLFNVTTGFFVGGIVIFLIRLWMKKKKDDDDDGPRGGTAVPA